MSIIGDPLQGESDSMLLYEGGSAEKLHQVVSDRFSPHRLKVFGDQQINSRFRNFHNGLLGLFELGYGADVGVYPGELPDYYNIVLPVSGGGQVRVDDTPLTSTTFVASPGMRLSMNWNGEALNRVLIIPAQAIQQAISVRLGDQPSGPARFSPVLDDRNPAVKSWILLAWSFNSFAESVLSRRSPLGMQHFEHLLIDSLIDAQPHCWSSSTADRGPAIWPSALRRAVNFCDDHAHEPISVTDIAQAARVSVRTLREGFRTHLGTSPLAYLKGVRLDLAHQDLLAIAHGQATGTVSDVAYRWGFTHLGRFSAAYRRAYGQPPSRTLRRQP